MDAALKFEYMKKIINNMGITAEKARELTRAVNEIESLLGHKSIPLWRPIRNTILRGGNVAQIVISNQEELDFLEKLKENGFKVKIEDTRFYKEAVIKW